MLDPQHLQQRLNTLKGVERLIVGFSGGLDSTVLLHALLSLSPSRAIVAIHVNHHLHNDADQWAAHCRSIAGVWDIDLEVCSVAVESSGEGPEAAARNARYAAFAERMAAGDCLVTAHHQDDQAETLLLNLMRGSGPSGLAAMREVRPFAQGQLARPLLQVSRQSLQDYATHHKLQWIDDASNLDRSLDRNYMRHEILPALSARWPAAVEKVARSASLAASTSDLLGELADLDLGEAIAEPGRIPLQSLIPLNRARQSNALRRAAALAGLAPIPANALNEILTSVLPAREDAAPLVRWADCEARRYRDVLFLMPALDVEPPESLVLSTDKPTQDLGPLGTLVLEPASGSEQQIDAGCLGETLEVRFRQGGEVLQPVGRGHSHKLKKLFQEASVVPWMRNKIPLLYAGDELVAVAGMWVDARHAGDPGFRLIWRNSPPLR